MRRIKAWMSWTRSERVMIPVILGVVCVILCAGLQAVMIAHVG